METIQLMRTKRKKNDSQHDVTEFKKVSLTNNNHIVLATFGVRYNKLIIRKRSVWPTLLLMNVFTALKGTHFYILFLVFVTTVVSY